MLWACGPSDLPFQPLGAPRWAFRAATARMVRSALGKSRRAPHLLAKAVTKLCPLSHAPRAAGQCEAARLREMSLGPTERWAEVEPRRAGQYLGASSLNKGWERLGVL